ncbi:MULTISPECIES: hypothetical protein [Metabacillus]|uniref:Uncharacterized protein n=1 Tax=Metabacillus hrfriensis TaxID=3048891 RepID=A0ACD4RG23_9BACI|nr:MULTISPECIES: hypothetical protein [Metabacillus]UAL53541.1 hypothetical protein K8L98_07085 [Metabacillus dongyingensis]UOK59006.1 hypothetical protein MGI18_08455 [Bacillus sp. OVS6]USK29851.1 hypothetical protein LIT32_07005 [Bacillus sp. CMF21]WHZ59102.1 hypothetical protein QLQ22_07155 [Metabacillus sp. CT-WN-B3]
MNKEEWKKALLEEIRTEKERHHGPNIKKIAYPTMKDVILKLIPVPSLLRRL